MRRPVLQGMCTVVAVLLCQTVLSQTSDTPRVGRFTLGSTTEAILGADRARKYSTVVPAGERIEWEVAVPETYDSADPPGLLVYVSPSDSGAPPRGWLKLLRTHNLIWVAANRSGNRVQVPRRISYAVLAAGLVADRYELDEKRIYLSGFSGGARVSGLIAGEYPTVFRGAVFIGGAELWDSQSSAENLERMRQNRYVFLVGSEDANRAVARSVHSAYEKANIPGIRMTVVRRMGHVLPEARYMNGAIEFLDGVTD